MDTHDILLAEIMVLLTVMAYNLTTVPPRHTFTIK